jgi:hypothetical protein
MIEVYRVLFLLSLSSVQDFVSDTVPILICLLSSPLISIEIVLVVHESGISETIS